jgi:adenine-specific DNA methylase
MLAWAMEHLDLVSAESYPRFNTVRSKPDILKDGVELRKALLDFIADFANWDKSTSKPYLETARALTQVAHEALGGEKGTRPLVVDPFAGGGAIPLEALRVGADTFASDLNPVAVLLNKVVLEYIPKYGQRLADEVRRCGEWIRQEAEKELTAFYPTDPDGARPIAYLWARTITCEGPGCGTEVPLIRSLWLAKKGRNSFALGLVPNHKLRRVDFKIIERATIRDVCDGTVRRGSATCPCCGFTTPVDSVRAQLKVRKGGATDACLFCVVTMRPGEQGRSYRLATKLDQRAVQAAINELERRRQASTSSLSLAPDENISHDGTFRIIKMLIYGAEKWSDLFTPRQTLALTTIVRLLHELEGSKGAQSTHFSRAVRVCLALALDKQADLGNSLTRWKQDAECPVNLFGRQAIPIVWDFAEACPLSESSGSWLSMYERTSYSIEKLSFEQPWVGQVIKASATAHPLPDDSADAFITDPPYYDSIAYAALSDFFYVWLKRSLEGTGEALFCDPIIQRGEEIIVDMPHEMNALNKDVAFYEERLTAAFSEGRRISRPSGIGTVVFASKSTTSWEAILKAVIEAGWVITASWPIDTEMEAKVAAIGQARLMSSIHLVCRPREHPDGTLRTDDIGDWRDVLAELPRRMHDWMPRLQEEGVVGADAIFACLGPALEVFSRYSRVEKASGEAVTLKEYLEQVWAAVAKEALTMIFEGAQTTGFEEDARLTAMWLWTLSTGTSGEDTAGGEEADDADDEESSKGSKKMVGGFNLEYDAARKIAQGLGAHLEQLDHLVQVKGDTARLLPVGERTRYLFGKDDAQAATPKRKKKEVQQTLGFADELEAAEEAGGWGQKNAPKAGETVLDRVHQAMILFAAGRSDALKRFLVEDGIGRDDRFWVLAQALSALYPKQVDEKRWVDGVLARKKGLGF